LEIHSKSDELLTTDTEQCDELNNYVMEFLKKEQDIDTSDDKPPIPTGIDVLDAYLGGGILCGGIIQIVGNPGTGKSALAARIIANGQRLYKKKFIGIYADSEEAMSSARLGQLGIQYPPIEPVRDLTVEKIFKLITGVCQVKESRPELLDIPSIIVWDSIANTNTDKGDDVDNPDQVMGLKARIISQMLPKYMKRMRKYNVSLVAINQLRDKIDLGVFKQKANLKYLSQKEIPGGQAVSFSSNQLLFLSSGKDVDDDDKD
jgi:RecA/RadA recombinase